MPGRPKVQAHIDKARQFEADRTGGHLPVHWDVVVAFYSALHWVQAVAVELSYALPKKDRPNLLGHGRLLKALDDIGVDEDVLARYLSLQNTSEWVRYKTAEDRAITPAIHRQAVAEFQFVRDWAAAQLTAAGYTT